MKVGEIAVVEVVGVLIVSISGPSARLTLGLSLGLSLSLARLKLSRVVDLEDGAMLKRILGLLSWCGWRWSAFVGRGAQIWLSEEFHLVLVVTWRFVHLRPHRAELGLWSEGDLARSRVAGRDGR